MYLLPPIQLLANQDIDSISVKSDTIKNYNFEWKQTILPASLISVGAVALAPTFIRNGSRHVTKEIIEFRGNYSRLTFDDYVQYVPVIGAFGLGCMGVKARHDLLDRTFIIATSYATLGILVNIPKLLVDEKRPEFSGHNSFPSGHTATVFMGAELVRIEYGNWYGAGAYAVAAGVGFLRMYNGRHWLNDVVVGAGVGILSARVGEWSCELWRKLLNRKQCNSGGIVFTPIINTAGGGFYGATMCASF